MKRICGFLASMLMVLMLVPTVVQAAAENITVKIVADKSAVNPGDTVNFTVSLGVVNDLGGLEFYLDIPEGLTIVDSSVVIPDGVVDTLRSDGDIVCPAPRNNYKWAYMSKDSYAGTSDVVILTFACTVDTTSSFEGKSVGITVDTCFDQMLTYEHNVNVVPATITIEKKKVVVTGVSLDKTTVTLKDGENTTLIAVVEPSDADNKNLTWSSDNEAVATVSNGTVTAVKEGTATITVTTTDGGKTATCAITVICNHTMTKTDEVAATCGKDGNIAYYTCSKCGVKYADENGTTEVTEVVTKATGNHINKEVRDAVAATEEAEGYTGDTYCSDCGTKLTTGESIAKLPHTHSMTKTNAVEPTCVKDGNVEYYTCSKCKKVYSDETGTKELTSIVVTATGHAVGTEWLKDDENHWNECTVCFEKQNIEAHTFNKVIDKEATEDETGLYHEECACGEERNINTEIPKLEHVHVGIEHVEAVAATCQSAGNVEYWTCSSDKCEGKYYGDSKCQLEISEIIVEINPDNHVEAGSTWSMDADKHVKTCICGTVVVEGSHEYDNEKDAFCNLCNYQKFYQVISGAASVFELSSGKDIVLTVDGKYDLFDMVTVDSEKVEATVDTNADGVTVITFSAAYLEKLALGKHTVEVSYSDGKVAGTEITVKEKAPNPTPAPTPTPTPEPTEVPVVEASKSPKTGVENNILIWIAFMTVVGMTGFFAYKKVKK